MNILHISDIHFRKNYEQSNDEYKSMLSEMRCPLIPLTECVKEAQSNMPIDLVIISGDLTEDGEIEDYRFLKCYMEELIDDAKMVVTLGNHDIKENFRAGWLGKQPSKAPYNVIEEFDNFYVVSFDNSVHGNNHGHVSDKQFAWLKSTFEQIRDKPIIFVTHHHLLREQSTTTCLPEAESLLKILQDQDIICIMNGHTHHQYVGKAAGTHYYTVASMSFCGEDEGNGFVRFEERYGYNLYSLNKDKIKRQSLKVFYPEKFLKFVNITKIK